MKTIIVPTDFSENAFIASQYALELAKAKNYKVILYHVYIVLYSGYDEKGTSVKQIEWADEEAEKSMKNLLETLRAQFVDVDIQGECVRGFLMDALTEHLKKNPAIELIVMGTKGVTNVAENIFGSTTYEVLKKSSLPVLVVPANTPEFSLKHVGFFSAYSEHEMRSLAATFDLVLDNTRVDIIHLNSSSKQTLSEKANSWRETAKSAFPERSIAHQEVEVDKVDVNAVTRVVDTLGLDILVFTRPHKTFFQQIFARSLTKAVANYPVIPSLFFKE